MIPVFTALARFSVTIYGALHGLAVLVHDGVGHAIESWSLPILILIVIAVFEEVVLADEAIKWHHRLIKRRKRPARVSSMKNPWQG